MSSAIEIVQPGEEPFVITNTKEISQIIDDLHHQKTTLRVASSQGRDEFLTRIINVDHDNGFVYFDMGIDELFNKRLLASPEILFVKDSGIRIKWKSTQHSAITLTDGHALRIEIPKELIRLQRRELFRLATPATKPLACEMLVPNAINHTLKDTLSLNLVDISLGGIGVLALKALHPSMQIGAIFDGCKINFPELGLASLKLEVRNILPVNSDSLIQKHRIGLSYIHLSRANEGIIHKYTYNLERELLKAKNVHRF